MAKGHIILQYIAKVKYSYSLNKIQRCSTSIITLQYQYYPCSKIECVVCFVVATHVFLCIFNISPSSYSKQTYFTNTITQLEDDQALTYNLHIHVFVISRPLLTNHNQYICIFCKVSIYSLFRNKMFALNEMFQRNASKFAIFYVKENPRSFFPFSFRATLYFSLMNALVYVTGTFR